MKRKVRLMLFISLTGFILVSGLNSSISSNFINYSNDNIKVGDSYNYKVTKIQTKNPNYLPVDYYLKDDTILQSNLTAGTMLKIKIKGISYSGSEEVFSIDELVNIPNKGSFQLQYPNSHLFIQPAIVFEYNVLDYYKQLYKNDSILKIDGNYLFISNNFTISSIAGSSFLNVFTSNYITTSPNIIYPNITYFNSYEFNWKSGLFEATNTNVTFINGTELYYYQLQRVYSNQQYPIFNNLIFISETGLIIVVFVSIIFVVISYKNYKMKKAIDKKKLPFKTYLRQQITFRYLRYKKKLKERLFSNSDNK